MKPLLRCLIVACWSFLSATAGAETNSDLWQDAPAVDIMAAPSDRIALLPGRNRLLQLDVAGFEELLSRVSSARDHGVHADPTVIELPLPEGGYRAFRIINSGVMPKALADKYPRLHAYAGEAVDDRSVKLRMEWSPSGLHAMVSTSKGVIYLDPYRENDRKIYLCFYRHDAKRLPRHQAKPDFIDPPDLKIHLDSLPPPGEAEAGAATGDRIRTYRIAIAASSGYSRFFGGTKEKVLAAIVTAINRVTGIYQQEMSVGFQLVASNDKIIYLNKASDPYFGLIDDPLLEKNQVILDREIGSANYDIGHVFIIAAGGLAMRPSVCDTALKAQGYTGSEEPVQDAFWVDYVAHEIGHQLGADHTFNSPLGACNGTNRVPDSAYEIGSGVTIMGYAGICEADDIQEHSIPHFHARSFDQINDTIWSGSGSRCGSVASTGNTPPTVDAGSSVYTIPMKTPFYLQGSANDAEGDRLSYSWEEYDLANKPATVTATEFQRERLGIVPLFRSFDPKKTARRIFPKLSSILIGRFDQGEVLPGYARSLRFRLVVRDGQGGMAASPIRSVTVTDRAGPFVVRKPEQSDVWRAGSGRALVRWAVAGTDQEPVSCGAVNIALSTDGGRTFARSLNSGVANDGAHEVEVPNTPTDDARIRIVCAGNIFGNISTRFTIAQ